MHDPISCFKDNLQSSVRRQSMNKRRLHIGHITELFSAGLAPTKLKQSCLACEDDLIEFDLKTRLKHIDVTQSATVVHFLPLLGEVAVVIDK